MKLVISKSKNGSYYSKIKNDYKDNHIEKYLSLQLPKDNEYEYGLYNVDGFMSVYEKKDGTTEFKFIVTDIMLEKKYEDFSEMKIKTESDIGQQIEITDEDLPF